MPGSRRDSGTRACLFGKMRFVKSDSTRAPVCYGNHPTREPETDTSINEAIRKKNRLQILLLRTTLPSHGTLTTNTYHTKRMLNRL